MAHEHERPDPQDFDAEVFALENEISEVLHGAIHQGNAHPRVIGAALHVAIDRVIIRWLHPSERDQWLQDLATGLLLMPKRRP